MLAPAMALAAAAAGERARRLLRKRAHEARDRPVGGRSTAVRLEAVEKREKAP